MYKRDQRRRGFTLIEMVVVIGIILVIIGALLPALVSAWHNARRTRSAHDLQVISGALEEYRKDFSDYPRVDYSDPNMAAATTQNPGAIILCWALIAPADETYDGANGPGFRLRGNQGRVYQAYLNPEQFKTSIPAATALTPPEVLPTILDANGHPYLYFPANTGAKNYQLPIIGPPPPANFYVGDYPTTATVPFYNYHDNRDAFAPDANYTLGLQRMQRMVGDMNMDGQIGSGEVPKWTGPYLLWGAGPDELFGPSNPNDSGQVSKCDDVTNVP